MTPHELGLYVVDYVAKTKLEREDRVRIAYLTTYLHRVEKMPPLSDLIDVEAVVKKKTPESMLEMVKAMNAAFGGTVG